MKVTLEAVAYAVNELHTGSIGRASSTDCRLAFSVNNMEAFTGIQFDIQLPQPMSYLENSAVLFRREDHTLAVNPLNANTLRVLAFSPGNKNFTSNEGKLIELVFQLNGTGGYYTINISNVILSNAIGENILSATYGGSLQITAADIHTANQLAFGEVSMTAQKESLHTVYNYGQEPLTISQLTFSNNYFSSNQTLPVTIQPYQQLNIPVIFKKESKGEASGVMKIFSNDPDASIYNVELTGNAFAPNYLKINTQHFRTEEQKILEVEMDNIDDIVALQFDLSFPTGFIPDMDSITLSERKRDHLLATTILNENSIRLVVYSPGQKALVGQEGAVLQIPFRASNSINFGSYDLVFPNALMSNKDSENVLYNTFNGLLYIDDFNSDLTSQHSYEIRIFPNPVINELNIAAESDEIVSVEIVSLTGQAVYAGCFIRTTRINVSDFPSGIYVVKTVESRTRTVGKVVKN